MEDDREVIEYFDDIPIMKRKPIACPFSNLLEIVTYYHGVAQRMDLDELDCFIDNDYAEKKDHFPKCISAEDMMHIIIATYVESLKNTSSAAWMDFDEKEMDALLDHEFFREYDMNVLRYRGYKPKVTASMPHPKRMRIFKRKYGLLELYTYTKLQSIAASVLPENRSGMLWYLWCFEDFLPILVDNGFCSAVADVYKQLGKNWFCRSDMGGEKFRCCTLCMVL